MKTNVAVSAGEPAVAASIDIKTILVPVDFSENSRKAVDYAVAFARQFGANIIVLHVIEPYLPVPEMPTIDWDLVLARMRGTAEAELTKVKASVGGDVLLETRIRSGRPDTEIVDAAREWLADLMVISTHGRTGLAHVFLGSTAERIVRHAPCPVLTVRQREHDFVKPAPVA